MPQEFFEATIRVAWPKGKRLGIYQVLAVAEDRTMHQLEVTEVSAYGQDIARPRKRVSQKAKRK